MLVVTIAATGSDVDMLGLLVVVVVLVVVVDGEEEEEEEERRQLQHEGAKMSVLNNSETKHTLRNFGFIHTATRGVASMMISIVPAS